MNENLLKQIDENRIKINTEENVVEKLKKFYRILQVYTTNALEGNTMTETETKVFLEDGITIGGKTINELKEIQNSDEAFTELYKMAYFKTISEEQIKNLITIILFNTYNIPKRYKGDYRTENVIITGTTFQPHHYTKVEKEMKEFIKWLNTNYNKIHPVELAALVHLKVVTIHPFINGNGRLSRLLLNTILLQFGYSLCIIYPINRTIYIETLKKYQLHNDKNEFCDFIAEQILEEQKNIKRMLFIK